MQRPLVSLSPARDKRMVVRDNGLHLEHAKCPTAQAIRFSTIRSGTPMMATSSTTLISPFLTSLHYQSEAVSPFVLTLSTSFANDKRVVLPQ